MSGQRNLDSARRHPQTAATPPVVVLKVEDDTGRRAMAEVVRVVLEDMRETTRDRDE